MLMLTVPLPAPMAALAKLQASGCPDDTSIEAYTKRCALFYLLELVGNKNPTM